MNFEQSLSSRVAESLEEKQKGPRWGSISPVAEMVGLSCAYGAAALTKWGHSAFL
jgi:hypothetical protein